MSEKQRQRALALGEREINILEYLNRVEKERVITISRITDIPRTTVLFLLKNLEKRGLVNKLLVGKHYEWAIDRSQTESFGLFGEQTVEVHFGIKNFEKVYESITRLSSGERIFVFQGNKSAQAALTRISSDFFSRMHAFLKKRKIIIEGVTGESLLNLFESLPSESLRSHWGRATIVRVVPDEYINFDTDIFSTKHKLYIFNFEKEIVVTINDPSITKAFHSLIVFMFEKSRQVDLNGHIRAILEKRGERVE